MYRFLVYLLFLIGLLLFPSAGFAQGSLVTLRFGDMGFSLEGPASGNIDLWPYWLTLDSDNNTAIYAPFNDQMAFQIGGAVKLNYAAGLWVFSAPIDLRTSRIYSTLNCTFIGGTMIPSHGNASGQTCVSNTLEVDGATFLDNTLTVAGTSMFTSLSTFEAGLMIEDSRKANFGNASDAQIQYQTTTQNPHTWIFGVPASSRAMVIMDKLDASFNFAHPLQLNPTLFGHSSNQSTTEWWGLTHNKTNSVLNNGEGAQEIRPVTGTLIIGNETPLTDAAGVDLFRVSVPDLKHTHGMIFLSIHVENGVDAQSFQQSISWAAVAKAGVITCTITSANQTDAKAVTAGTLVAPVTCNDNADNTMDILVTANTSMAGLTSFEAEWYVQTVEDYSILPL